MNLTPPPFDLRTAWGWAFASMRRIASLFGDPVAIRDQRFMRRGDMRTMLAWLRPLETLLRRVLILEAARRPPPPRKAPAPWSSTAAAALRAGACRRAFRVLPCADRSSRTHTRTLKSHPDAMIASGPLAYRFDALVGALDAPLPLIRRLARRLYARDPRALALARINRADRRGDDAETFAAGSAAEFEIADFLACLDEILKAYTAAAAFDSS